MKALYLFIVVIIIATTGLFLAVFDTCTRAIEEEKRQGNLEKVCHNYCKTIKCYKNCNIVLKNLYEITSPTIMEKFVRENIKE